MSYIIFENQGEIDLRTISTFGCSVKETDNPIGFFGTGMKYAIAILLRTGHKITVQSGSKQWEIKTSRDKIRGKEFEFVNMGQQPLGFTTELGKNWQPWMAYRELYCNAKDESGAHIFESAEIPPPTNRLTRFCVSGNEMRKAWLQRDEYILNGQADFVLGDIELIHRESKSLFYKGIRVADLASPSIFTYNHIGHVELTEDRTLKDFDVFRYSLSRNFLQYAPRELLEPVLLAKDDRYEHGFDFHGWTGTPVSRDFLETVGKLQRESVGSINYTALKTWREKGGGIISPRRIQLTSIQAKILERAIDFCNERGFPVRDEFPIIVVETIGGGGLLAIADKEGKQIFLTAELFNSGGVKTIARALIEEYLHLRFHLDDCTREMQNWLFDKVIALMEELNGEPI